MSETKTAFAERTLRSLKKKPLHLHNIFWINAFTKCLKSSQL